MEIDIAAVKVIEGDLSDPKHREGLVELINAYLNDEMGGGPPLSGDMEKRLVSGLKEHPAALLFFAEYQDRLIGLAICFIGFSTFHAKRLLNIHDLVVLAEYRRNAVAEKILSVVERRAKDMDCCKLTLEVRTDNAKAMRLYEKFGFGGGKYPMYFRVKTL